MSLRFMRAELCRLRVTAETTEEVFERMQAAASEIKRLNRAYSSHLGRIRRRLPLAFREWLMSRPYLHDAQVIGPTESFEQIAAAVSSLSFSPLVRVGSERDVLRLHIEWKLLLFEPSEELQRGCKLYVATLDQGRRYSLLAYLGVIKHDLSPADARETQVRKLWIYDEADLLKRDGRLYAIHRILFSDGSISEIVFEDFHCFEVRFL